MSRYRFTGETGEEVNVGWDKPSGSFFAQAYPVEVPPGVDPEGWDPEDDVREVAGAMPFDVLDSATLVARLAGEGITVPEEVRALLAADDDPARTVDRELDRVLGRAALLLDRPGVPGSFHPEFRRDFQQAANAVRLEELLERLSVSPGAPGPGRGGFEGGVPAGSRYGSSYSFSEERVAYDEDLGYGCERSWAVGWDEYDFTFTAESHVRYFGPDGEFFGESEEQSLPVVGALYFEVLRSADLVERLAEMGVAVPEDVGGSLAADDVRASVVAAEYDKAKARHPGPEGFHTSGLIRDEVRRVLDRDDHAQALDDRLAGPYVPNTTGQDVSGPDVSEFGRGSEHLDRPPDSGPDLGGGPDYNGLDR